jgi:hypothetical protein
MAGSGLASVSVINAGWDGIPSMTSKCDDALKVGVPDDELEKIGWR